MKGSYELLMMQEGVPTKVLLHRVNKLKMHWHKHIEIILVLQGSVNIRVGSKKYILTENDLILINSDEIHSTSKTNENNTLLVLQIDPELYNNYYPGFNKITFKCKSFKYNKDEQERFDIIRYHLARIVWELNKKKEGYKFKIGSEMLLLGKHLINNFYYQTIENNTEDIKKYTYRINRIINYIDENLDRGVTLQEVADSEELNVYYLSHYIKKTLGISFQEYINLKRLDKAIPLLISTKKTITEISFESGFSSVKTFNNLMRKTYNCTPTQYRKNNIGVEDKIDDLEISKDKIRSKTYFDVDRNQVFLKLFTYLKYKDKHLESIETNLNIKDSINIDVNKKGIYHNSYWDKLTTFGRAAEGLRAGWQKQLKELQDEIGFEYIRFHGIFSDEMMVCNIDEKGNIIYNWSYIDELFDFFKKVNIKPFVELGLMPSEIKKSDETIFWWKGNISGPKDISLWTNLVKEFIKHCINRYGLNEVETWYFEVWNEPDLEYVFWVGGREEYFEFYRQTVLAIKSISNKLKVGGPSITHQVLKDGNWFEDFLEYCNDKNIDLDFISFHIYPETFSSKEEVNDVMIKMKEGEDPLDTIISAYTWMKRIYFDEDHTYNTINDINHKINTHLSYKPETHITEWSASSYCRNLINDTCFVATFIIRNILKSIDLVNSIGYWTFTDIMEEFKAGISHFHGGFGLINKDGLKKPSYYAYYILSKLGKYIIDQGEEYIVTKDNRDIHILAYNFAYFDEFFINGDISALTNTDRYSIYENKAPKNIYVNVKNICGYYKIVKYELNRENGSVFDEWVNMGAPENMTEEEIKYLNGKSRPKVSIEYMDIDGEYSYEVYIPVHGVVLITLQKQENKNYGLL